MARASQSSIRFFTKLKVFGRRWTNVLRDADRVKREDATRLEALASGGSHDYDIRNTHDVFAGSINEKL